MLRANFAASFFLQIERITLLCANYQFYFYFYKLFPPLIFCCFIIISMMFICFKNWAFFWVTEAQDTLLASVFIKRLLDHNHNKEWLKNKIQVCWKKSHRTACVSRLTSSLTTVDKQNVRKKFRFTQWNFCYIITKLCF